MNRWQMLEKANRLEYLGKEYGKPELIEQAKQLRAECIKGGEIK